MQSEDSRSIRLWQPAWAQNNQRFLSLVAELGSDINPSFRLPVSHSSRVVEDDSGPLFDLTFANTILSFGNSVIWLFLTNTGIVVPNSQGNSEATPDFPGEPHVTTHYEPFLLPSQKGFQLLGFFGSFLRALVVTVFLGENNVGNTVFFEAPGFLESKNPFCENFVYDGLFYQNFTESNSYDSFFYLNDFSKDFLDDSFFYQNDFSEDFPDNGFFYLNDTYENFVSGDFFYLDVTHLDISDSSVYGNFVETMASSSTGAPHGGGIPLHEFRKDTPPGWAPNLPEYPLRLFFERLKLWYSIFDGDDTMVGPLVAGRLQGKAQRLGMQLRLIRPDGQYDVGSDALQRLSTDEVRDPSNPSVILQHAIPSGVQALCNSLKDAFGMSDQEVVSRSIEEFFEFKRGRLSFQEYAIEWDIRLEEATTKAGLELNDVAKFYLFFRGSGLPARFVEDIKLQLQGDLRRYQDARTIALRLITKKDDTGDNYYQDPSFDENDDESWDGSYWTDDSWSYVDEYDYADGYDDPWQEVYYEDEYEDWYGENEYPSYAGPVDEHEPSVSDAYGDPPSSGEPQEAYPVKGKGKGLGCTVCGSRWHSAASCPVQGGKASKGKGKQKGKQKGYRKGYGKGKSYGKRPSYGKSKGKGSWWPSGGKGKGYYGYADRGWNKTLTRSFGETATERPPQTKTVHFKLDSMDSDEPPVISLGRTRTSVEESTNSDTQAEPSTAASHHRSLKFSFPTAIYSDHMTYHTVSGEKRRGLLVDPGAASGLIGSETLRDILDSCVPKKDDVVWRVDRAHSVSGISGQPEETLGEVSIPLQLAGATGSFAADVLGGEGSLCPALLSNPSLRKQRAAILCDYFANGDGVMVVSDGSDGWHYMRILLTDSGHYLLPIDHHSAVAGETKAKVANQMQLWSTEISSRWSDVRHCFLQQRTGHSSRELERSEQATTCTTTVDNHDNQDTTGKTSSTTSAVLEDSVESRVRAIEAKTTINHDNRDTTVKTSSTTSGRYFNDDAKHISGPLSHAKHISGPLRPFLDNPTGRNHGTQDTWHFDGEYLVRRHEIPRRALFVPECSLDCPLPRERLSSQRTSIIKTFGRRGQPRLLEDDWQKANTPCKDLEYLWTGSTKFKILPEVLDHEPSSLPHMATDEEAGQDALDPVIFPCYGGDQFPSHWSDERRAKAKEYYKGIPEEYYSRSGRRPITPGNTEAWLGVVTKRKLRFHAWEWCSGSGRLSLCLLMANLLVGPPIDYRYGWDISYAPHQALLQRCHDVFAPQHIFASPSWDLWFPSTSAKDPQLRDSARREDLPALQFMSEVLLSQHMKDRGFLVEQPHSSKMFQESPLSKLGNHSEVKMFRCDQCMYGAQDEEQRPLRKATMFLTNRRWCRLSKRCGGHRGRAHGMLNGRFRGCSRTSLAMVFPKRLCQAVVQDFWSVLRKEGATNFAAWPTEVTGSIKILYSCERCQLGRAAPPGCEHTLVPGECRYGQPAQCAARGQPSPPAPSTTTAPSAPSVPPAETSGSSNASPALRRDDLEDITGPFKFLARSGDYSRIQIEVHQSLTLDIEPRLYLKAALMQLVESCLDVFSAHTKKDLRHWLQDPILLRVFQDVFSDVMNVLGVLVTLRPWQKQVPDPHLSSSVAPMRLVIFGHLRHWTVGSLEDMRVLSHQQLHADIEEADWHVYLFGVCHEDYDADRPLPPGVSGSSLPSSARPAAPLVPRSVEKKTVGKSEVAKQTDDEDYQPSELDPDAEEEEFKAVRPVDEEQDREKTLKPLFDFKKVYKRLQTDLVERDPMTAKRLLLGLHERFYHCPISDFKNMLLRAGLSSAVLPLAEEAVMSCSICRKYVRLPNRPQIKIGAGASSFNLRVQLDLFQYKGQWVLLMIDEATRYKAAGAVAGREHNELLGKMFEIWFVIFGPPYQLVMDQETSLMSHEAGRELERFLVERVPKGTTAGTAAQQHTGTGLIERHIGLTEISMLKLEAELDRQGIAIEVNDLARECAMSHNISLNYGGVTPSMAVFGVIPRPFYQDDGAGIMSVTGALQTDITPFEKALRVRQLALSTVQRSVAEDRIARANKTRTQQIDLGELVPGVTRVDFHRETQGDVGWRGPAELLKVNKDEGTAIISYQGRPYLVSMRHIRPHQAGVFVVISGEQEACFLELQKLAEQMSPYKAVTIGWVPITKNGLTTWTRASSSSLAYKDLWPRVVSLARSLSSHNVGGIMAGQSIRSLHPPKGSVGVLLMWNRGERQYACHEHNNDQAITFKKITARPIETLVFLYTYYFVNVEYRPHAEMKVIPSEGTLDRDHPIEVDQPAETASSTGDATMPMSSPSPSDESVPMDMEEAGDDRKRKGPETRTVTLGPESKRSRVSSLVHLVYSDKVMHRAQHVLINLYWIMHWTQSIPMEYPKTWNGLDNNVPMALWDIYMSRNYLEDSDEVIPCKSQYLFTWPGKQHEVLYASLETGEIYKVDDETDNISEEEAYTIWPQVEEADAAEIKQFVETNSFNKAHADFLDGDTVIIDAVWVRKWKRYPDGSRRVKSRLCARGCFDRQKDLLSTRSTTATRLSQRLLLSTASNQDLDVESWDIGGAFLKGMNFEAVRKLLESKGIKSPKRKIAIVAPANVWRHLANFDPKFKLELHQLGSYVLICLKPVYGLSDAPLAWQLCLHGHFESEGGKASLMDENMFYWCGPPDYRTTSIVTTHVDDCGSAGKPEWLTKQYNLLVTKFGKVTRQKLPFCHCGVQYSRAPDGYHMSQDDFCRKLKTAEIDKHKKDDDPLSPQELTTFRSILGGLLWLTATRLDLVADVCLLQSNVTRAKITHLRQANNVVRKAQAEIGQGLGIHFRRLQPPLRLACIHDSSAAGNVRNYAQEGILVLLCEDRMSSWPRDKEYVLTSEQCAYLGGKGHILWAHGAKAKRISYSTSHAETLAGISGLEASSLVAVRLAELQYLHRPASLQALIACQEHGVSELPVDTLTDCRDFFELCSGSGNIPQDKGQRLYVLAYREARMSGRVRWMTLVPTQSMTADALTKSMTAPPMMQLLSTGVTEFKNEENHPITMRSLPVIPSIEEKHFDMSDKELIKEITKAFVTSTSCAFKKRFLCLALLVSEASATSTSSTTTSSGSDENGWFLIVLLVISVIVIERVICNTAWLWQQQLFGTSSTTTSSTSSTATSSGTPQRAEKSTWTKEDGMEQDKSTMLFVAGLEAEILSLKTQNASLDRRLRHVNEDLLARQAEVRQLRDRETPDVDALRAELQRLRSQGVPANEELYSTSATGRTWHRRLSCHHLRGTKVRHMRPCTDCAFGG